MRAGPGHKMVANQADLNPVGLMTRGHRGGQGDLKRSPFHVPERVGGADFAAFIHRKQKARTDEKQAWLSAHQHSP